MMDADIPARGALSLGGLDESSDSDQASEFRPTANDPMLDAEIVRGTFLQTERQQLYASAVGVEVERYQRMRDMFAPNPQVDVDMEGSRTFRPEIQEDALIPIAEPQPQHHEPIATVFVPLKLLKPPESVWHPRVVYHEQPPDRPDLSRSFRVGWLPGGKFVHAGIEVASIFPSQSQASSRPETLSSGIQTIEWGSVPRENKSEAEMRKILISSGALSDNDVRNWKSGALLEATRVDEQTPSRLLVQQVEIVPKDQSDEAAKLFRNLIGIQTTTESIPELAQAFVNQYDNVERDNPDSPWISALCQRARGVWQLVDCLWGTSAAPPTRFENLQQILEQRTVKEWIDRIGGAQQGRITNLPVPEALKDIDHKLTWQDLVLHARRVQEAASTKHDSGIIDDIADLSPDSPPRQHQDKGLAMVEQRRREKFEAWLRQQTSKLLQPALNNIQQFDEDPAEVIMRRALTLLSCDAFEEAMDLLLKHQFGHLAACLSGAGSHVTRNLLRGGIPTNVSPSVSRLWRLACGEISDAVHLNDAIDDWRQWATLCLHFGSDPNSDISAIFHKLQESIRFSPDVDGRLYVRQPEHVEDEIEIFGHVLSAAAVESSISVALSIPPHHISVCVEYSPRYPASSPVLHVMIATSVSGPDLALKIRHGLFQSFGINLARSMVQVHERSDVPRRGGAVRRRLLRATFCRSRVRSFEYALLELNCGLASCYRLCHSDAVRPRCEDTHLQWHVLVAIALCDEDFATAAGKDPNTKLMCLRYAFALESMGLWLEAVSVLHTSVFAFGWQKAHLFDYCHRIVSANLLDRPTDDQFNTLELLGFSRQSVCGMLSISARYREDLEAEIDYAINSNDEDLAKRALTLVVNQLVPKIIFNSRPHTNGQEVLRQLQQYFEHELLSQVIDDVPGANIMRAYLKLDEEGVDLYELHMQLQQFSRSFRASGRAWGKHRELCAWVAEMDKMVCSKGLAPTTLSQWRPTVTEDRLKVFNVDFETRLYSLTTSGPNREAD
eukprot:c16725_g1_i1.p1 GENE.c16725_g1_i1~~c16725_g1_i1.p1  ORF type:complete len:1065 (-),score=200.01 c16725_g1_i1:278-3304(-)